MRLKTNFKSVKTVHWRLLQDREADIDEEEVEVTKRAVNHSFTC